jgi:hypothetical protein
VVLFLSLIFCKQEETLLFFGSVSGYTCLTLNDIKTPRLSLDILQAHKKATDPKTKYRKNYNLYHDGIHPIRPLAKLWMYNILRLAKELNE